MVCSHKFVNFVMHTLEFASEEMLTISEISEFQERRMIKKKRKDTNKPVGILVSALLTAEAE